MSQIGDLIKDLEQLIEVSPDGDDLRAMLGLDGASEGFFSFARDLLAALRQMKSNPAREQLEKRVFDLENKFFAFQCGAQAQMERDRKAYEQEKAAMKREQH